MRPKDFPLPRNLKQARSLLWANVLLFSLFGILATTPHYSYQFGHFKDLLSAIIALTILLIPPIGLIKVWKSKTAGEKLPELRNKYLFGHLVFVVVLLGFMRVIFLDMKALG